MSQLNLKKHHIVVIGAGFGGIDFVNHLKHRDVQITLIDKRNHHLFQPLLYQVASASLAPSEIAWPVRHLFRNRKDVRTLMAEVVDIDKVLRKVILSSGDCILYDSLVIATGATHTYFGNDNWAPYALSLKTLEDATKIRSKILTAFEKAEHSKDDKLKDALQTFVVVGGGATGVEIAGTIAELAHNTLKKDFRFLDTTKTKVLLIEAGPRVLPMFPESLSRYTTKSLEKLGIKVLTNSPVTNCDSEGVVFNGERLMTFNIIWAAGVKASPAAVWLGAESDWAGRVIVDSYLNVPSFPEIFVIGDTASVKMSDGSDVLGIAPAAKQGGEYVANVINNKLKKKPHLKPFKYNHQGNFATIGRSLAVIDLGFIKLRGGVAWWIWKLVHIYFLVGIRSRLSVAISWVWNHTFGYRSSRIIVGDTQEKEGAESN